LLNIAGIATPLRPELFGGCAACCSEILICERQFVWIPMISPGCASHAVLIAIGVD
jgi:hypothetical protein